MFTICEMISYFEILSVVLIMNQSLIPNQHLLYTSGWLGCFGIALDIKRAGNISGCGFGLSEWKHLVAW